MSKRATTCPSCGFERVTHRPFWHYLLMMVSFAAIMVLVVNLLTLVLFAILG